MVSPVAWQWRWEPRPYLRKVLAFSYFLSVKNFQALVDKLDLLAYTDVHLPDGKQVSSHPVLADRDKNNVSLSIKTMQPVPEMNSTNVDMQ